MEIRNAIANPCSFCLHSFKFSSFLLCFKLHGTRTIIDRYFVETRAPCTRQENWCIHHVHVQEYEKNRKSPEAWKITRENYRHHPFFFFFFIHLCKCWCRYIYNNNNNSDDWKCIWSILKLSLVLFAFLYILFRMKCCTDIRRMNLIDARLLKFSSKLRQIDTFSGKKEVVISTKINPAISTRERKRERKNISIVALAGSNEPIK